MVNRDPSDLRAKLSATIEQTWNLNQKLELAIHHRAVIRSEGGRPTMVHASLPWNAQIAFLIFDLHAMSRRVEVEMLAVISNGERARGTSSENTRLALAAIVNLAEAMTDDHVIEVLRSLDQWCTRARLVLGLIDGVAHLPTRVGEPEMRCPWCDYLTLRVKVDTATAYCVNPGCVYGPNDHRRPHGRVDTNIVTGEIVICWQGELPVVKMETA